MGCCCDKSAMPVVDSQPDGRRRGLGRSDHQEAVGFDFVVSGNQALSGNSSFAGSHSLTRRRPPPQGRHSPNFAGTTSGTGVELQTFTPRDFDEVEVNSSGEGSRRSVRQPVFMTNAYDDIGADLVGSFVGTLRDPSVDPLSLIMRGSVAGSSRRTRRGLTAEDKAYIGSAATPHDQRGRLAELEEMARGEIIGAMLITSRMVELGLRQILPTIRQRHTSLSASQKPPTLPKGTPAAASPRALAREKRRPVLVIHAANVALPAAATSPVEVDGSQSAFLDSTSANLMASVISDGDVYASDEVYSRRETAEERPPRRATHVDPSATPARPPPLAPVPQPQVVEQYEILALSGRAISGTAKVTGKVITSTWDFLSLPEAQSHLNAGNTFFRFVSGALSKVTTQDQEFVRLYANISGFADEAKENFCPIVDPFDPVQQAKYMVILVKAMYILPGVQLANITQELLASLDYNRNCQPGDVKFEEKDVPHRTFREVKTIVKFVYSLTIQMYVTEITDPAVLFSLKESDGMVPTKVIVLERTKRNPAKLDSTAKCKSVLIYYAVNGGVLVSHTTIVMNTSVPSLVARILNTFGGQGCGECAYTAKLTRAYMLGRFGDSRK